MKPLAVVATHPIQYQAPFYRYLSDRGLPIKVFFLSDHGLQDRFDKGFGQALMWDIPLIDGYSHEFLPNLRRREGISKFFDLINPAIIGRLCKGEYSAVIVHGYRSLSMLMAMCGAKLGGIPLLYRAESSGSGSGLLRKNLYGPAFRSTVTGCLSIGSLNDAFYSSLGVPPERRFLVPYAVDNRRFQNAAANVSKLEAREALHLDGDQQIVLYAGKLVPWKQPDLLLRAFAAAAPPESQLLFAGDGEMRIKLEELASARLPGRARFLGFMNQSKIPLAYRAADLLVLPSRHEPWGLVVNEVMNFGVPVIVSDRVGCGPDLVISGLNGDTFDHSSEASLAASLAALLSDPVGLRRMGDNALTQIQGWGYPEAEAGILTALDFLRSAA